MKRVKIDEKFVEILLKSFDSTDECFKSSLVEDELEDIDKIKFNTFLMNTFKSIDVFWFYSEYGISVQSASSGWLHPEIYQLVRKYKRRTYND